MSDRIHLINGRAPLNKAGDYITRRQVEAFATEFAEKVILPKVIEIIEHYMRQTPELMATMMADMCAANGLAFKGPDTPASGGDATTQSGDAAAQEIG